LSNNEKAKQTAKALLGIIFIAFIALIITNWIYPAGTPFGVFNLWTVKAPILMIAAYSAPLLFWAIVWIIAIRPLLEKISRVKNNSPLENPKKILINKFYASIIEGSLFRWLIFLNFIWIFQLFNWMIFGIFEQFYINSAAPIVSCSSLGIFDKIIYHPFGWSTGAAIIATSAIKTKYHNYQGFFGIINSWYIGLYLSLLTIQFGLLASIITHFLYDVIIDLMQYLKNKPKK